MIAVACSDLSHGVLCAIIRHIRLDILIEVVIEVGDFICALGLYGVWKLGLVSITNLFLFSFSFFFWTDFRVNSCVNFQCHCEDHAGEEGGKDIAGKRKREQAG